MVPSEKYLTDLLEKFPMDREFSRMKKQLFYCPRKTISGSKERNPEERYGLTP